MTSPSTDSVNQSVAAFKSLNTDDRLVALALIYTKAGGSIPKEAVETNSPQVSGLVKQIEQMSQEGQVDSLRELLPGEGTDQKEIALDPNPAKALTELASGTALRGQYGLLNTQSKLATWYQIGQKLGSSIVGIPSDLSPSSEVTELLNSLQSLDVDQQISFLSQVV